MTKRTFGTYLNERAEGALNERSSLDARQISELVSMIKDAFGKYSKKDEADVSEFIMSMGEDIAGFKNADYNAVMKAYKSGKVNESLDESDELCEECGKKHLDESCSLNEASMVHGRVSKAIHKWLKGDKIRFKTEFDGDFDSFFRIDGEDVSIVVDDDSIMVSSEAGDYRDFKHNKVDAAIEFTKSLL